MADLYTKTRDKRQTILVRSTRISKGDPRVKGYGAINEANSMLALTCAQNDREYIRTTLHTIQGCLFSLRAELASDEGEAAGNTGDICSCGPEYSDRPLDDVFVRRK